MFKLDDIHLEAAQQIAQKNRRRKSCDTCYDRGWIGVSEQNLLVLCTKCVEMDTAMDEWKTYVCEHDDLKEHFSELFEEKAPEASETKAAPVQEFDHTKNHPNNPHNFTPGNRRSGHTKKIG